MIQILKEVTVWDKAHSNVPNHTYHINGAGKMVAYVKQGTDEVIKFKTPVSFDRRGRKFTLVSSYEDELPHGARKVAGSNGKVYIVHDGSCTCPGFKFRGNCKHV